MKNIFIVLICLISLKAFAADIPPQGDKDLSITLTDCQKLPDYQPSVDVDYKPGVDVNGKPVAPADLSPSPVKLPEKYSFDLNVDEARNLGMIVPPGTQGLMKVGTIAIDKDGQVTFNGQPMEDKALTALKAACAAKTAKKPPK
jgi:hypothetical protein